MFDAYLAYHARLRPSAPAIVLPRGAVSFAELDARVSRAAMLLRALEATPARPVAVDIGDVHLHWLVTLALARLGVPSAPGADRDCPLRVTDRPDAAASLVIGHRGIDAVAPASAPPRPPPAPDGTGRIMLSSGTTGVHKRIALSWRVIERSIRNVPVAYGVAPGPWLMVNPPAANLPFVLSLGCWALGLPVLMLERALDATVLQATRPGLVALLPGQLGDLLDRLPVDVARWPVRVVTAGAPVSASLLAMTRGRLTDDLLSVYGTSEVGAVAIATPALLARAPSAAGIVLPGVAVEIVDQGGGPVAIGALGEVRIRSGRGADGYLRGPASAFRDGWFRPGDLGRWDADGALCLEGRVDDLMNLGGEKVLPAWVEAAALTAPGVDEVAAFALRRADGVERCCLAVVAGDGFAEGALHAALAPQCAILGAIDWLRFSRLPRNAGGKIDRRRLREEAGAFLRGRDR